jgi:hypothetical protein
LIEVSPAEFWWSTSISRWRVSPVSPRRRKLAAEPASATLDDMCGGDAFIRSDGELSGLSLSWENWTPSTRPIVQLWRTHWAEFVPSWRFPEVRRIYTTNLIESMNARPRENYNRIS